MPPLVEYVEWVWSSTWAEIGPKQVRPVAPIVGGWHRLPPRWADVADMFFLFGQPFMLWGTLLWTSVLLADQRGLEPPPAVCQRQERRHTNWATRTTDEMRWGDVGDMLARNVELGRCCVDIKNIQNNYVLWFRVLVDGLLCSKVAPPVRVPWNRWIVRFARPLNYHVPALLVR